MTTTLPVNFPEPLEYIVFEDKSMRNRISVVVEDLDWAWGVVDVRISDDGQLYVVRNNIPKEAAGRFYYRKEV